MIEINIMTSGPSIVRLYRDYIFIKHVDYIRICGKTDINQQYYTYTLCAPGVR